MPNVINVKCAANSIYLSDENGQPVLGQAPYGVYGIQNWQYPNKYFSKVQFSDVISIQMHTQKYSRDTAAEVDRPCPQPQLFLCDFYDPNTGSFRVYGQTVYNTTSGSTVDLNARPYFKGDQTLPSNSYTDPFTNTQDLLRSTMWSFSFSDLSITASGVYYLLFVNYWYEDGDYPTASEFKLFSEPMQVQTSHLNTLYFTATYNTNRSDEDNVIVSGWYDDASEETPYNPLFTGRIEGYILDLDPKAINVGYLQQLYDQIQVYAKQKRMKTLKLGELSTGIPPHILEQATALMFSDLWFINGWSYIMFNPSSQTTLTDIWKSNRKDGWTLFYATTAIMERYGAQKAIVSPSFSSGGGIFTGEFSGEFA